MPSTLPPHTITRPALSMARPTQRTKAGSIGSLLPGEILVPSPGAETKGVEEPQCLLQLREEEVQRRLPHLNTFPENSGGCSSQGCGAQLSKQSCP